MRWHTVEQLGHHQSLTPEGFLLVEAVPIARTGAQVTHQTDIPSLACNGDGFIHIERDASEVFRPDSIASFEGKPIVDNHPIEDVTPANWKHLAIGHVQNVRRGSGVDADVLLADLLFTDQHGIDLVRGGKRAVSVGYDAHYRQITDGMGAQHNIVANHLALVDVGRCGARCTIGDSGEVIFSHDGACCEACADEEAADEGKPVGNAAPARRQLDQHRHRVRLHLWHDRVRIYDAFVESEHPRGQPENKGEFAKSAGGASAAHQPTKTVEGKRVTSEGAELPDHIQKLKIPPAWSDVTYSPDPEAALLATGKDAKGRRQSVYSAGHSATQAAAKFARVKELDAKFADIQKQNEVARKSKDPKTAAAADATALIMATGIRPGSERNTGAEKQAYGATTLEGKHVVVRGDKVSLVFTGKKGVPLNIPVDDPGIAKMLIRRKQEAGPKGQLFPVSERALLDHVHTFGEFKSKDLRTRLGTATAMDEVQKVEPPTDPKGYKRAVMQVAKAVATKLGNTPVIALTSYINPVVFSHWQQAAGMGATADASSQNTKIDLPDAHWGEVGADPPDWRKVLADEEDPDDEQLDPTPEDVVTMLGFDPADEDDGEQAPKRRPIHLHIH